MSAGRAVPIRTCMGCGTAAPQAELRRIVRDDTGTVRPDTARRAPGRGGYLHLRADCLGQFARRKGVLRSLRASVDRPARVALVAQLRLEAGE